MVTSSQAEAPYDFSFIGGALCIDFTNSIGRGGTQTNEHLDRYEDLVRWAYQAALVDLRRADRLRDAGRSRPSEAEAVLGQARELREVVYRIFQADLRKAAPAQEDLDGLNAALAEAMARSRVAPTQAAGGFVWGWNETDELASMLWPVTRSAAELLTSPERGLIRECGSDSCEWLFLDSTKNRRRRWCDMRSCGNRAKVRRHRLRQKEEGR